MKIRITSLRVLTYIVSSLHIRLCLHCFPYCIDLVLFDRRELSKRRIS